MYRFFLFTLAFALSGMLYAQKAPIKYGKPSMEDMTKTVYEIDTSAPAVILCNYGYFDSDQFLFTHIIRVKILKKEGYKWADWIFNTGNTTTVRGKTFNLVDGKIVSEKLSSKSVFRQEVIKNYYYITKVAMPNVKAGSVIDIELTYSYIPLTWYFQETIPVLHSELVFEKTNYVTFSKNYFGYVAFDVNKSYRWVTTNVPAFQTEPFMAPIQNYLAHFEFDISSINIPGSMVVDFATSWNSVAEKLYQWSNFGGALQTGGSFFKSMAKEINSKYNTETDKVKAAMDFIHKVRWNGSYRLFLPSSAGLRYYYQQGEGSSAVVNLSLIRLLQKIGIQVYPVVLRTRDKGRISDYTPTLINLNYVMAYAKIDGKGYLLDGTDPYAPFYVIPEYTMNYKGRIIGKDTNNWIQLTNNIAFKKRSFYMLTLDGDDLSLKGNMSNLYAGYAAYKLRKEESENKNSDNHYQNLKKEIEGLEIEQDTLMNLKDVYKPVKEKATISIENQCFEMDSLVYLSVLPDKLPENPFKQEKRRYPVDFIYPQEYKTTVIITLPDNYKVVSLPAPVRLKLPGNKATYSYVIQQQGNKIMLNQQFKVSETFFVQKDYELLKSLYQQVVEKENEQVVLKSL